MKIQPKKILLCILVLPGLLFLSISIAYFVSPYFETIYSPNYDFHKFNQIKIGMTEKEVVEKLGEPLQKNEIDYLPQKTWYYSKGKNNDANYFARVITFVDNKVSLINKETLYD